MDSSEHDHSVSNFTVLRKRRDANMEEYQNTIHPKQPKRRRFR